MDAQGYDLLIREAEALGDDLARDEGLLREMLQSAQSMPQWLYKCPFLDRDTELLGSLVDCNARLSQAGAELARVVQKALAANVFSRPADIEARVACLEHLLSFDNLDSQSLLGKQLPMR